MSPLVEAEEHGGELDQFPRGAEHDEDHRSAEPLSSSNAPRHIPIACPNTYSGVTRARTRTSRCDLPALTPYAAAARPHVAAAAGASTGRRATATARAVLSGKNATTAGKKRDSRVPCPST